MNTESGIAYSSHARNPLGLHGQSSIGYYKRMDSQGDTAAVALVARLTLEDDARQGDGDAASGPDFHTHQASDSHTRSVSVSSSIYFDTAEIAQSSSTRPSEHGDLDRSNVGGDSVAETIGIAVTRDVLAGLRPSGAQGGHHEDRENTGGTQAAGDESERPTPRQAVVVEATTRLSQRRRDISSGGLDGSGSTGRMSVDDNADWSISREQRLVPTTRAEELELERVAARRRLAQSSQLRYEQQRSQRPVTEVLVPRWQPDVEVTICPICSTQFSFFKRKHHCRKCGRVVCAACSPHRITIPYQFIVQPPSASETMSPPSSRPRPTLDPARTGSSSEVESLGGGERVRLCNPCVPDPNVAPLQTPPPHQRRSPIGTHTRSSSSVVSPSTSIASGLSTSSPAERPLFNRPQPPFPGHPPQRQAGPVPQNSNSSDPRNRSSTVSHGSSRSYQSTQANQRPVLANAPSIHTPSYRGHGSLSSTVAADPQRPLPRRPRIPEEDECPICHEELPSSQLPNSEGLRAEHITQCIEGHMQGGSTTRPPPQTAVTSPRVPHRTRPSQASSSNAVPAIPAPIANTPEARIAAREQAHAAVVLGLNTPPPPQRLSGLFPYKATEKDCVDEAECTICLEEFEVGVDMARLECFCRFHLRCIRGWFDGHYGQCPVHHQGF